MAQPSVSSPIPGRRAARMRTLAARNRVLGDPSRLLIVEALADGPRLISELATISGLHRNTVRAHLARLERAGLVHAVRRAPVGPGRPAIEYRLTEGASPSGNEQRLLIQALLRLVSSAYRDGAAELARSEGERIGHELANRLAYPTAEQAVRQLTTVLRRLAFSPQVTVHGGVSEIALRSCPFEVAPDDPRGAIVCAFHLGLIRGVVDEAAPQGRHEVRLLPHVEAEVCRAEVSFG